MSIKINGVDLFSPRDYIYFQDIIPYQKFNNNLPCGYYTYTFSLFPNEMQPSGYLNFSHFDDISFNITSNINVLNNPYSLNIIVIINIVLPFFWFVILVRCTSCPINYIYVWWNYKNNILFTVFYYILYWFIYFIYRYVLESIISLI